MKTKTLVSLLLLGAFTGSTIASREFMYYVTRSGKTYHKRDCTVLSGKVVYEVTSDIIAKQKLKPCKKCKPL